MFDIKQTPDGWVKSGRGWLAPAVTPQSVELEKLKGENKALVAILAQLAKRLERLENG